MARDPRVALTEILSAVALSREATAGLSFSAFEQDRIRVAAAQRALEIISEATRHLPSELTGRHVAIPWQDIKMIGNTLRHQYFRVDNKIVWDVIRLDLDALEQTIEAELKLLPGA